MPRRPRNDEPGAWHHVFNRGIARRTVFESERDIRKFLSLFARCARAGRLEIHAYCVLTTHFHFLVRSPCGDISSAMQWIQNQYVRWFNRGRRRDGPLLRGRFGSKRAESLTYRRHLVRYIDFNSVGAGLAATPALYRHGSAHHYSRARGPLWLSRTWIESEIGEHIVDGASKAARYARRFGVPLPPALLAWVEQRAASSRNELDDLDNLVTAAPQRVLDWMRRKSSLADGSRVGLPLCTANAVEGALELFSAARGEWRIELDRGRVCAYLLLHVGLLRDLCAATLETAARAASTSTSGARTAARRHAELVTENPAYSQAAAEVAVAALRACHAVPCQSNIFTQAAAPLRVVADGQLA